MGLHVEGCGVAHFFEVCREMVVVKELLDISARWDEWGRVCKGVDLDDGVLMPKLS